MKNFNPFLFSFFTVSALFAFGATVTEGQTPWSDPLFPPLERPQEAPRERPRSGLLDSSIEALSAVSEEDTLEKYSKGASAFEKMFAPALEPSLNCLVKVRSTGASRSRRAKKRQIALGTVVSEQGWILTKASELKGKLFCETSTGDMVEAEILGLDPANDLALLNPIDPDGGYAWQVANWAGPVAAITGDWLVTPLDHQGESHLGIVSVDSRMIPPSKPFIGIFMGDVQSGGVEIQDVQPKSPAEKSGLKIKDIIMKLDETSVKNIEELREFLEQCDAGDIVKVTIRRDDEVRSVKLTLASRDKVSLQNMRSNQQNRMGTRLSGRRKNFPLVFQHDTTLQANECGGPIVNVDGDVVGINIARAGRVDSLAIPAHKVIEIVEKLGTGDHSPKVVNANRIRLIESEISDSQAIVDELDTQIEELKKSRTGNEERLPGYQAALDDMAQKLDRLREEIDQQKDNLDQSQKETVRVKRMIRELERERKRLETGVR